MVSKNVGALVVTGKNEPVGIVTERDILRKCCGEHSCTDVKVKDIMSRPLVTVDIDTPIGIAVEIMTKRNIRRLLVTEKGSVTGIVTQKDLLSGTLDAFSAIGSAFSTP
jgi:CBS domain-containing protein